MKIKTVQYGNKLIIMDGVGPLRYVDLTKNTVEVYKSVTKKIQVKYYDEIKPHTTIAEADYAEGVVNDGGTMYLVKAL